MRKLSYAEESLTNCGLAVRELAALPGFEHRAFVLVAKRHERPTADVTDSGIPLLSISAAHNRKQASIEFLEWIYQTNLKNEHCGIGSTEHEARQRARVRALETLMSTLLKTNLRPHRPGQHGKVKTKELENVNGRITTTTYHSNTTYETVLAELVLSMPPFYLAGVGCGPNSEERAVSSVFTKLNTFFVRRTYMAPWISAALEPHKDGHHHEESGFISGTKLEEPQIRILNDLQTVKVASARFSNTKLLDDLGLLSPVDAARLGLRTPTHLSLAHGKNEVTLSRIFHENSKLHATNRQLPLIDRDNISQSVHNTLSSATRDYRFTRVQVELTLRSPERPQTVERILSKRRSSAPFANEPPDLRDLAYILLAAYGVTGRVRPGAARPENHVPPRFMGLRATPSAGGLNSNDVFLLVDGVMGITPGLYYFNPDLRCLQLVNTRARMSDLADATGYSKRIQSSSAAIILAGAFSRIQWKYWERGYRMALLDCGHLAQSLVIAATEINIVAHPIGGFIDDQINSLIGFDGINDSVLHLLILGKRKKQQ